MMVAAAKAGDTDAYAQLVRAHQSTALKVAYLITRDRIEAEDVTQDAFINAYRALARFDETRPFRPWVLTIVRNLARNRLRRSTRQNNLRLRAAAMRQADATEASPEAAVVEALDRRPMLSAYEKLPEKQRLVVGLRYLVGMSEEETAAALGIPVGTVKSRTARGVDRLRQSMAEGTEAP